MSHRRREIDRRRFVGRGAKAGVLIKNAEVLETMKRVDSLVKFPAVKQNPRPACNSLEWA